MKAPAFQFYVKDWLCSRRVLSMSGDSVKAYMYLLCESWLSIPRAALPNNDKDLAQIARVSDSVWNTIKTDVLQHFKIGECTEHKGYLYNEKLLEISRNYEKNQRPNNKNARRTRINHETYAKKRTASASASASAITSINSNTFIPPTFEEFNKYCIENKFGNIAERAFKYYADSGWKDSRGKQVRSWKGKLQAVWFKDENKDKNRDAPTGKAWC